MINQLKAIPIKTIHAWENYECYYDAKKVEHIHVLYEFSCLVEVLVQTICIGLVKRIIL